MSMELNILNSTCILQVGLGQFPIPLFPASQFLKITPEVNVDNEGVNKAISNAIEIYESLDLNDSRLQSLMVNAAYAIMKYGLIAKIQGVFDSCVVLSQHSREITDEELSMITRENVQTVLTLIMASKQMFWIAGNHTAPDQFNPSTLEKYIDAMLPNCRIEHSLKVVNIISNWASTLHCLILLGFPSIKTPLIWNDSATITGGLEFTPDLKWNCSMMPHGTDRYSLCYSILKELVYHPLRGSIPDPYIVINLLKTISEIRKHPARYHIRSVYLTGLPRLDLDDSQAPIGLLGSFVRYASKNKRLIESSYLTKDRVYVYEDHPSYDYNFNYACERYSSTLNKEKDNSSVKDDSPCNIVEQSDNPEMQEIITLLEKLSNTNSAEN